MYVYVSTCIQEHTDAGAQWRPDGVSGPLELVLPVIDCERLILNQTRVLYKNSKCS